MYNVCTHGALRYTEYCTTHSGVTENCTSEDSEVARQGRCCANDSTSMTNDVGLKYHIHTYRVRSTEYSMSVCTYVVYSRYINVCSHKYGVVEVRDAI